MEPTVTWRRFALILCGTFAASFGGVYATLRSIDRAIAREWGNP